jgi:hypothetical protein
MVKSSNLAAVPRDAKARRQGKDPLLFKKFHAGMQAFYA